MQSCVKNNLVGLIFSKDRAMQLQATIESFFLHCRDSDNINLNVLYRTSSQLNGHQYGDLKKRFSDVTFIEETNFKEQVLAIINGFEHVLFLVDDNLFIKDFCLADVVRSLCDNHDAVGFSLRLGRNTDYCYPLSSRQALPQFRQINSGILKYYWPGQQHDFGYPLEVSSSVYRVRDILELLMQLEFSNPNTLEGQMAANSQLYSQARSSLLCYENSVTFCNPVNIVQNAANNKYGIAHRYSAEQLADYFSKGKAIDVEQYIGFTPNGAHQEVELYFKQISETVWRPMFSIIMANYNRAEYIGQAVESVLNQTFKDWELIIVEDCSTDNSLEIINRYLDDKRIRLIQHEHNRGYTAALKTGIANVRSEYFGILDSDDCLMPHAIATMYEFHVQRPQCGLIYSQFVACHEGLWPRRIGYCAEIPIGRTNLEMNVVSHFKTFKLRDYLKSPGYDEDILYAEDKDITYKMEEVTRPFFVDQCLYLFRELPNSLCHDDTKARIGVQSWEKAKNAAWERRKQLLSRLLGPNAQVPAEELLVTETNSKRPQHKPEFSIIMANYNHAKYVGEAIKSVLNQSFENWELIIVDDRSTDNSLEVIGPYLRDKRIRLVKHQQNKGYTTALKTAIAQVQSEYFGILDSDDCLSFDAVEVMYKEYVANPDCGFIYSQLQYCNEKLLPFRVGINKAILPGRTSFDCDTISQFKTFRMTDYLKTEGYNEDTLYAEDKDIIYKMEEVAKLRFVDNVLYLVRELQDSICHLKGTAQIGRLATAKAKINAIKRRCAVLAKSKGENLEELFNKTIKEAVTKYHYDIGYYFIALKKLAPFLRRALQNESKLRYPNVPGDIMTCHIDDATLWFAANLEFMKVLRIIKSCDIIFDAPRVSVYILTGRNSRFIRRAIESVLAQDYLNFELLIVDDADDTSIKEIIDCYPDYRISYTKQSFDNIAAKMNQAIINTKGEYIIGVDSNDFIEPTYIGKMVECAEKYPDADYFYPATSILIDEFDKPIRREKYPDFSENTVLPGFVSKREYAPIPSSGSLQRKSLFAKAGLYEKSDTADGSTFLCRNASKINFRRVDDSSTYFSREHADYYKNQLSLITAENKSPEPVGGSIKISVIMPCYNHAHYLPEAVKSIVNQTYKHWECIIVNDRSSDNTAEVAKRLIAEYPDRDIRFIDKPNNSGLADTRNVGIEAATSEWILPLDSDDMFERTFMQKAVDIIQREEKVDIIFANMQKFGTEHGEWIPSEYSQQKVMFEDTMPYASLYRKELWQKVGGYDKLVGTISQPEDWNFWISCSKHDPVVKRIPEKLFLYRVDHQSMYHKMIKPNREVSWALLATCHPDLYPPQALANAWQLIANCPDNIYEKILIAPEKCPEYGLAYFWRALVNKKQGNSDDAMKDCQTAVERAKENNWQSAFVLMTWQNSQGYLVSAAESLEKLLTIRPDFGWAKDMPPDAARQSRSTESQTGRQKILFYFDRIGNLNEISPAGTVIAILNFARALQSSNSDVEIHITGDLVHYPEQYESFRVIPLPLPEQREQFITDYDVVFFATHVRYFKGLTKPSGQIWVLWQHCWEADDRVSLSHISDFDIVICLSELHRASLRGQHIGDEKLITIPNLIDTDVYSPRHIRRNNHSIMFAGGLNPHKCIHVLMDAFRLVRQQVEDAELHIYGDGQMWRGGDDYGNYLKSIKPDGTYFHGYVDNKDMPQIYSKHSILCLPSKHESFGLVTVEAQACGCVPVVHNAGGVAATLADGQTGLLYSPNTPEKLAETIIKAIKIVDADPSVRQEAIDFVRNTFSINRAAEYISKLWDRITFAKKVNTIRTLLEGNEIEQANFECEKLLQKDPNHPDVQLLHALIMLRQGNVQKANLVIEELLENFPNHLRVLNNCGLMAMKAGDTEKALRYFTRAYKSNPWDKNTITNCYAILKTSGKYRDAKMLLLNYLTNAGEDAQVLQLFREIDNLIANTGLGTNVVSQEVLDNRQGVYCGSSTSKPLVSIIMPVYNGADYIGQAIESVLAQDYPNFELVIIDDGSTDNTKEVILRYNDERIRYHYQENNGVSSARNRAIRQAKGQYIMPLDADDMMTPDCIILHLQEFEKYPEADLIYCDVLLIDGNGNPIRVMNKPEYHNRRHLIRDLFRAGHPIVPFRLGIRRSVFDRIGFYDEQLAMPEDFDMIRRFVKAGLKEHHLRQTLHLRRMQPESLSRSMNINKARDHFEVMSRIAETFDYEELFPDIEWDKIPAERRRLHVKCLIAATYQEIGRQYIKSEQLIMSGVAFEKACSELNDCLKMDPENQGLRQLLQKSKLIRARYTEAPQQVVSK